jgi:hypothetical protein
MEKFGALQYLTDSWKLQIKLYEEKIICDEINKEQIFNSSANCIYLLKDFFRFWDKSTLILMSIRS